MVVTLLIMKRKFLKDIQKKYIYMANLSLNV